MYSLYRAWFGGEENYPRLERFSPPDVVLRVGSQGEHQFLAHKEILMSHSGYLKALLAATAHNSGSAGPSEPVLTSVSVSSVGGEAFAPLLNYMYTGRLEVSMENIYSVLLATHLLHMPNALEECRNALLRLRSSPALSLATPTTTSSSASILRPVPSRLVAPFCWPQHSLYTSPYLGHLQLPPALPVLSQPMIPEGLASSYSLRRSSPPTLSSSEKPQPISRSRSSSPMISPRTSRQFPKDDSQKCPPTPVPRTTGDKIPTTPDLEQSPKTTEKPSSNSSRNNPSSPSCDVVFDVACCDGPVQFHRVLNENYAAPATTSTSSPSPKPSRSCHEDEHSSENDENGRPLENAPTETETRPLNGSYTCKYCRHTFKSLYCYRKHAKRHLLPTETESRVCQDLNVQYYPCKICGSKFPSYYFVHKHRKLCHSEIDEGNVTHGIEDLGPGTSESADPK